MQVNVIPASDVNAAFRALTYTPLDANSQAYIENSMNALSNVVVGASNGFLESNRAVYENLSSDTAIAEAKTLLNQVSNQISTDVVYKVPYESFDKINYRMQQYVMLEPKIKKMYTNQEIEGYATYYEREPNVKPTEVFEYRDVVSGICDRKHSGVVYNHGVEQFKPLDFIDKRSVLTTWERALASLKEDEDSIF